MLSPFLVRYNGKKVLWSSSRRKGLALLDAKIKESKDGLLKVIGIEPGINGLVMYNIEGIEGYAFDHRLFDSDTMILFNSIKIETVEIEFTK